MIQVDKNKQSSENAHKQRIVQKLGECKTVYDRANYVYNLAYKIDAKAKRRIGVMKSTLDQNIIRVKAIQSEVDHLRALCDKQREIIGINSNDQQMYKKRYLELCEVLGFPAHTVEDGAVEHDDVKGMLEDLEYD